MARSAGGKSFNEALRQQPVISRNRWPSYISSLLSRWRQHHHISLVTNHHHELFFGITTNQIGIFIDHIFLSFKRKYVFWGDERNGRMEKRFWKMQKYAFKWIWYLKMDVAQFQENICYWLENENKPSAVMIWIINTSVRQDLLTLLTKLSLLPAVFRCVNRLFFFQIILLWLTQGRKCSIRFNWGLRFISSSL